MRTLREAAALVLEDGHELTADAYLHKNISGSWWGTLTFPAEAKTPALLNLAEGRLRFGDREAAFIRTNTSDWLDSPAGHFRILVEGSGDAPF